MAEKSLFFNAMPDPSYATGYDRNYSADDISDWFKIVCETGVLKEGLAVSAGTGLAVNVAVGKATIKGKGYINNAVLNINTYADGTPIIAPTGASPRYDLIVLRMNNVQTKSARSINVLVFKGTTSIPTEASLTRTDDIWDLLLGYAVIQPNADSIDQIVDTRGDPTLCPWFTAVKGYDDYYDAIVQQFESNVTMETSGTLVVTNIPTGLYLGKYSLVEVYVNGLKEENTAYSVGTSGGYLSVSFTTQKLAGAEISVVLNNFIQGEGLDTAIGQYNQWVRDVAEIKEAQENIYVCNGENDNQEITAMANAFIDGGTDYGSMTIKIVGNFGCVRNGYAVTTGGSGTSASPYYIFNIHSGNRKVILDFTDCGQVNVPISGVYANIFHGSGFEVVGLNLTANGTSAGTSIKVFDGEVICSKSRFWVNGYTESRIGVAGTFNDCRGSVSNATGNTFAFYGAGNLIRINGGQYLAYTGQSSARSAVVGQSQNGSVTILNGVSAPTISRSGYYQTNAVYQNGTGNYVVSTALVTTLANFVVTSLSTFTGTIPLSK